MYYPFLYKSYFEGKETHLSLSIKSVNPKNAALNLDGYKHSMVQIVALALASKTTVIIENPPLVIDTYVFVALIKEMGGDARIIHNKLHLDMRNVCINTISYYLSQLIHGSMYLCPALLCLNGEFNYYGSGGCRIGNGKNNERPIEHIMSVMKSFGASIVFNQIGIHGKYNSDDFWEPVEVDILKYSTTPEFLSGALVGGATKTAIIMSLSRDTVIIKNPYMKTDVRYNFAWTDVKRLIVKIHPDVLFLNQAELTAHVKALLVEVGWDKTTKIVSYCHYPALHINDTGEPCVDYSLNNGGLAEDIIGNLYSAVNIAGLFFVQSHFAKRLLKDYANAIGYKLKKEIMVLPPPYDNLLIKAPNNIRKGNVILYNHRLYDSYGTKEFIEFVKKNPDLSFLVTDPMINRGTDRSRYNQSPMTNRLALQEMDNVKMIDGSNRLAYIQAIDSCKVAIAPYRRACVWSMAVVDCFCRGLPVIGPNFVLYVQLHVHKMQSR